MKQKSAPHIFPPMLFVGAILLILANLLVLDYIVVKNIRSETFVLGDTTASACPSACLSAINKITGTNAGTATGAKEFSVELGTGTNATDDWADVSGAQAYVNTNWYNRIKTTTFEASVQVPTGNQVVYVRLFNVTDQHPVWFSEVSMTGTGPTRLAANVSLDAGNKLYQVQMKTQLKYTANLTKSRFRIVTY